MAPKTKKQKTHKIGVKTKNKRKAKPPPDLHSWDEDYITEEEVKPNLRDVMNTISSLSTWIAANEQS